MSIAATLIRAARRSAGLSQHSVAARARIAQPNVSRAESGTRDISTATTERLLRAAGFRLTVLPGAGLDAIHAGEHVRSSLADGADSAEERAYRYVIQLADDLEALHGAERVAACVAPPAPTGDPRFDAFIAGVVETRLAAEALPHPVWLSTVAELPSPWWVDRYTAGSHQVAAATPPALRRRGVLIDAAELVSV